MQRRRLTGDERGLDVRPRMVWVSYIFGLAILAGAGCETNDRGSPGEVKLKGRSGSSTRELTLSNMLSVPHSPRTPAGWSRELGFFGNRIRERDAKVAAVVGMAREGLAVRGFRCVVLDYVDLPDHGRPLYQYIILYTGDGPGKDKARTASLGLIHVEDEVWRSIERETRELLAHGGSAHGVGESSSLDAFALAWYDGRV